MNISKSLPIVAKAMGDQMGVNVVIRGNSAATNGKTIYLPELPKDDAEATLLARGFLDHEAAHVRLTDFSVTEDDPYLKNLTNIIEDVRIEKEMGQLYPGCAVNLRNLANHLAETGSFDFDPDQPDQLFLGWVLSRCRSRILSQNGLDPVFTNANQILEPALGVELLGKVDRLLDNVGSLKTTRASQTVATRILQLLRQEQQQAQTQCQQQDQSPEPSSEEDQGQGQQDQNDSSESNQDNETDASDDTTEESGSQQKQNQDDDSELSDQGKDSSGATPDAEESSQNNDADADVLDQILNSSPAEEYGDVGEMVGTELEAKAEETTPATAEMLYPGEDGGSVNFSYPPDLGTVRRSTSALRSRLGSLIQASKLKRSCAGRHGRRIDQRVLCRLPVGDTRIFRKREEKTAVNTAVIILLDRSGSMNSRMSLAAEATLAVTDALHTVPGVSVCSAAFPGQAATVIPLTPFGAAPAQTLKKYGVVADGGTPLAHALGWAAVQFALRQEPRKILVVATDGTPSNPERVRTYLERLADQGVEQMAVGIMDDGACGWYFKNHRTIQNIHELPNALFDMLKDALTR